MEFESLDFRYENYCRKHKLQPNLAILCSLSKVKQQKSSQRRSSLVVVLDHLKDVDFLPLIDMINSTSSFDIDAIDIINESPCILNEDQVLSLICAANKKLHTVSLQDLPFTKHFLRLETSTVNVRDALPRSKFTQVFVKTVRSISKWLGLSGVEVELIQCSKA